MHYDDWDVVMQLTPSELDAARRYHKERAIAQRAERESLRTDWLQRVHAVVAEVAPRFSDLHAVYLFGSLARPGSFHAQSDIDLAVEADSVATESAFWAAVERALEHPCDVRPLVEPIRTAVTNDGILVYERKMHVADQHHTQ